MAILDELNKAKEDLHLATNRQKMMVDANKVLRMKNKTEDEKKVLLRDFMSAVSIEKIFTPNYSGKIGFTTFKLTNNNANIKRLEQRVKDLEKKFTSQTVNRQDIWDFDGGYFENNYELDRVQIFFDSIPDASMRSALKGSGWNWSPTNKAWQRKITDAAIYSAKRTLPNVQQRNNNETIIIEQIPDEVHEPIEFKSDKAILKNIFNYIEGMNPTTSTVSSMGSFVTSQNKQVADMVVKEVVQALVNADKKDTIAFKIASSNIKFSDKQLWAIAYELEKIPSFVKSVTDFYDSINRKQKNKQDESNQKLKANKEAASDILQPIKAHKKIVEFGKWLNESGNPFRKQHFSKKYTKEAVQAFLKYKGLISSTAQLNEPIEETNDSEAAKELIRRGAYEFTVKLNDFLIANNVNTKVVISKTNFGESNYIYANLNEDEYPDERNSAKIRISDHSVSNIDRMQNEILYRSSDMFTEQIGQVVLNEIRFKLDRETYFDYSIETKYIEKTYNAISPENLKETDKIIEEFKTNKGVTRFKINRVIPTRYHVYKFKNSDKIWDMFLVNEAEESRKERNKYLFDLKNQMKEDASVQSFLQNLKNQNKKINYLSRTYDTLDVFTNKHPDYEFIQQINLGGGAFKYYFVSPYTGFDDIGMITDIEYPEYLLYLKENVLEREKYEPEQQEETIVENKSDVTAPIVLLWSEEFEDENVLFENLEQLETYYKSFKPNKPNGGYTKSKFIAFGMEFRVDVTGDKQKNAPDYNPLTESLLHYLERTRPDYDWKSLSSINYAPVNNPAIDPSTYPNQYVLNKAIEAWLMENVGSLDAALSREYTTQEKIFLKAYSGYGGLKDFGPTGVDAAFEFYTPKSVIQKMWALAYKHGYQANGSILEPSVGIGEFLQFANPNARQVAYEISQYSAMITKILYPTVQVNHMPFEKQFIKSNYTIGSDLSKLEKFDLVIGNPPYGNFEVLDPMAVRYLIGMGEVKHTGATNYVEYFIQRSLDLLKPGGLLVFIVGAQLKNGGTMFMDGPITTTKRLVHAYGELLDAYRLPDTVFERTGVTSDILVIKKRIL